MAYEIGTASNLEDLFTKIVDFATTDATLVGDGQEWQVLRQRRDNLLALTTNLTEPTTANFRRTLHTCRYDARSLNTNNEAGARENNFFAANNTNGSSYVKFHLRQARTIDKVRLRAPLYTSDLQYMLRNFRLQHSDDGSSWTTALTVNASTVFSAGEWRDYSVPGGAGSHEFWQIVIDSVQGSPVTSVAWASMLLLESDGRVANHFGSEVLLKGVGNGGTDEIFVGIRAEYDDAAGWYNLFLNGYAGYDANEQSWFKQPGALPGYGQQYPLAVPMVPCWDTSMAYWLVASGRSIRLAVKVSTNYEGGYLGFGLPYATPGQYPYPLLVGGSLVPQDSVRSSEWRYSYANYRHGVFVAPGASSYANVEGLWSSLYQRDADGNWVYYSNRPNVNLNPDGLFGVSQSLSAPYAPTGAFRSVWPHCMNDQMASGKRPYRECLGGGYLLQPCVLIQRSPTVDVPMALEGVFTISGYENAPENTAVFGGITHVVLQNAYRNSVHELWALSLNP